MILMIIVMVAATKSGRDLRSYLVFVGTSGPPKSLWSDVE